MKKIKLFFIRLLSLLLPCACAEESQAGKVRMDLQRFADSGGQGGNLVATTQNFVNAYTGEATSFDPANTMEPQNKTWYNTQALENSRPKLVHAQFAKNIPLPPNNGTTVEVRKPNTMPDVRKLTEGVIPDGRKYGYTNLTASVYQYGDYAAVSDRLSLHAIDPVAQDITEEFGAAGGNTKDKLARNIAQSGSNVMYCPKVSGGSETPVSTRSAMDGTCRLTSKVVAKAATWLKKQNAPRIGNDYIAIIHPSVAYDLRQDKAWIDAHQYAQPEEIYNGEIGKLHGVRFVETTNARIFGGVPLADSALKVTANVSASKNVGVTGATLVADALIGRKVLIGGVVYTIEDNSTNQITLDTAITASANDPIVAGEGAAGGLAVYGCLFLGKDAFGIIDVSGGSMEMIIKSKEQAGGPLDQFSTIGLKMETGGLVLYQDRILRVECTSEYSEVDQDEDLATA